MEPASADMLVAAGIATTLVATMDDPGATHVEYGAAADAGTDGHAGGRGCTARRIAMTRVLTPRDWIEQP